MSDTPFPLVRTAALFSPHADDELLGAGGTLLRFGQLFDEVYCVLMTSGDYQSNRQNRVVTADELESEFEESCLGLCCATPSFMRWQPNELDLVGMRHIVDKLDEWFSARRIDLVLIPEPSDHHDHEITNKAVKAALRPSQRIQPTAVVEYEVPTSSSSEGFRPNAWIDVTATIDAKVDLFAKVYRSQCTKKGMGRSRHDVLKHALYRGMQAGMNYAEAFRFVRLGA